MTNIKPNKKELGEKAMFSMLKQKYHLAIKSAIANKEIDLPTLSLVKYINSLPEYFTASNCSGRICLMNLSESEEKKENAFYKKWHRKVKVNEIWSALQEKTKEEIWFKYESFCMLAGTNTADNARRFIEIARNSGIKRVAVNYFKEGKYLIELFGTQLLYLPVKQENKLLVDKKYIELLVKKANTKMDRNKIILKRFEKNLRKDLK